MNQSDFEEGCGLVRGLAYELWEEISPVELRELIIEFVDHAEPGLALINIAESVDPAALRESVRNRISQLAVRMNVDGELPQGFASA